MTFVLYCDDAYLILKKLHLFILGCECCVLAMSLNPLSLNISKCRQTVAVKIIRAAYIHLSATKFSSSVDFQQNLLSIGKTVLQQDTAKLERNAQQRKVSIDINELVR